MKPWEAIAFFLIAGVVALICTLPEPYLTWLEYAAYIITGAYLLYLVLS